MVRPRPAARHLASWAPAPPQVASICAGRCVASSVFESRDRYAGGTARLGALEGQGLALKERATYDRMIAHQRDEHRRGALCWNPSSVARPHRLAFAFRDDDGLNLDAEHLALVCPGKRPLRLVGRARGPSEQRGVLGPGAVLTASASSASCQVARGLSAGRRRDQERAADLANVFRLQSFKQSLIQL